MASQTMLPPAFHPVLDELRRLYQADPAEASAQVRRVARCSPAEARQFLETLKEEGHIVRRHPELVALLLGDPQPSLLHRFQAQRAPLLRLLRRGRRLDMLRALQEGGLTTGQARTFMQALQMQGEHWLLLQELYAHPGRDFWQRRPEPDPPREFADSLLFPPDQFDPQLFLEWLGRGQDRVCVLWVRRLSGAPREQCQQLVDRLDELLFDGESDPWQCVSRDYPELVAALAGLPNPLWLQQLQSRKTELFELLDSKHSLAAVELVSQQIGCNSQPARRFLRLLEDRSTWELTLRKLARHDFFPPPPPVPAPPPLPVKAEPVPEPVPVVPPTILLEVLPEVKAETAAELHGPAEPAPPSEELIVPMVTASPPPRRAMPWDKPAEAAAPPAPEPARLSLDDPAAVLAHLAELGEACSRQDWEASTRLFGELEEAGFNRQWVSQRHPELIPWLPEEPWNQQIPQVAQVGQMLAKIFRGETSPLKLAEDLGREALHKAKLDELVGSLETAWKTKNKADLQKASTLLMQSPELNDEVSQRLPWLAEFMDLDHDGTSDLVEIATHPGDYFLELLQSKFPDLEQRLGAEKIERIRELLPELIESTRQRNMRNVMRVMSKLRLGPADVKSLIGLLKALLKRR